MLLLDSYSHPQLLQYANKNVRNIELTIGKIKFQHFATSNFPQRTYTFMSTNLPNPTHFDCHIEGSINDLFYTPDTNDELDSANALIALYLSNNEYVQIDEPSVHSQAL